MNEKIAENAPVSWTEIPYAEAKTARRHSTVLRRDKYGDIVRVVQIGGDAEGAQWLLDGTLRRNACAARQARSSPFRIVREEAIAAGIRRIEAVSGDAARQWAKEEAERQQKKFEMLTRKKSDVAALPAFEDRSRDRRDA